MRERNPSNYRNTDGGRSISPDYARHLAEMKFTAALEERKKAVESSVGRPRSFAYRRHMDTAIALDASGHLLLSKYTHHTYKLPIGAN
jgi:hypothetical protein